MTYVVPETGKVVFDAWNGAVVRNLALRKKQELVEELKGSGGWLMDRSDD